MGVMTVYGGRYVLGTLSGGTDNAFFEEQSLLRPESYGRRRQVTMRSVSPCALWILSYSELNMLIEYHPSIRDDLLQKGENTKDIYMHWDGMARAHHEVERD